ncbi:flavoprotein-like protein [Cokeromyces recurvatus]|uniref:flavoprotein-like protein n=1 Tax=Cokeromyces recurvatus TaxID=90255 RepID=UPI00221F025E|nr:flavoprotein-like protein [Cokeromyces recurvatus]KAI7903998.1 flavoprotein-like protein [Cokeromyces recurvatus]
MPTVYIIIYSLYHHIYTIAKDIQKGLESEGVTVQLFQVPETLSEEILEKLHAPPKPDIPIITVDALIKADAFLFGVPTRFGTFPAQMKSFLDATGALWATGALAGKFAGTFFSTASQHGGQETTAYTLMTYFAHYGLNYVPLGFTNSNLFDNTEVVGGSAWGAGTVANGDGSREPTEKELEIARTQGENFAKLLNIYHRGLEMVYDQTTDEIVEVANDETVDKEISENDDIEIEEAPVVKPSTEVDDTVNAKEPSIKEEVVAAAETTTTTAATAEPTPVDKEEPKSESKPKTEEKKPSITTAEKENKPTTTTTTTPKPTTASKPTPKKEEKKESKCFCM